MRLLCDMRRYDRALREAYNADRKLRAAGQGSFVDHHDIAQIIGESQLCLGQDAEADKSFQKSLQSIKARLATHHGSLDLRECQKTMNAIATVYMRRRMVDKATPWIAREDSLYAEAQKIPYPDSVYLDEMKAEITYCRAMWAHAQGRSADAEKAFAEYLSTQTAKQLGSIINSCRYLMATGRYEEAARNMTQLDVFMGENGYQPDLENIGRFMIPLANERAEESSRMKTQFIQQIFHEVRTPLNVLSGFSQRQRTVCSRLIGNQLSRHWSCCLIMPLSSPIPWHSS